MKQTDIIITTTGTIHMVAGHFENEVVLSIPGTAQTRRASHIEPVNGLLRFVFHAVRRRVSDDSVIAAWTRRMPVRWRVNIIDGPTFGSFRNRQEAIDAEVSWLYRNQLGAQKTDDNR